MQNKTGANSLLSPSYLHPVQSSGLKLFCILNTTPKYRPQATDYRQLRVQTKDQRSKTTDYILYYRLQILNYRLQTSDYILQIQTTFSLPSAPLEQKWFETDLYCKQFPPPCATATDYKPQTTDNRLQTTDYRL